MLQRAEQIESSNVNELAMDKEYKHVSSLAEKVMSLTHEYQSPPYPKSYEVLFTYFSGANPKLRQMTDKLIASNGHLTREDLDAIYKETLDAQGRFEEVQLETGQKLNGELDEISDLVEKYMSANSSYHNSFIGSMFG